MNVTAPFEQVQVGGGRTLDLYILRFSADGTLLSPLAQQHLLDNLSKYNEVFLFSHGWNNTFDDALARYHDFIGGFIEQGGGIGTDVHPVLIGVIWPSISFLFPWEDGPQIAASDPNTEEMRRLVMSGLRPNAEARLGELIDGRAQLNQDEARLAAQIVRDGWQLDVDPEVGTKVPDVEEILEAWAALDSGQTARPTAPDDFGDVGDAGGVVAGPGPEAAGGLKFLDPRNLLRMGTVWAMKDRAGAVGARGVAVLLRLVLARSTADVHLIGHSFGARLLMSAISVTDVPRRVRSLLLLQPAVNRWCFAESVVGTGREGGYRPVLQRVELPVLSTFSSHDFPLHETFHLAVRGSSLGEPTIAAFGDTDRYGALGGYGPAGLGDESVTKSAVVPLTGGYSATAGVRVIAVDGSGTINGVPAIGGHSDVSNPVTWWALRSLTSRA